MRRLRRRRQLGISVCVTLDIYEREIEPLVAEGLIKRSDRSNKHAIRDALYALLDARFERRL
jgi:hypothetical protein